MGKRIALITGVTGQDGTYLARLLVAKGYDVHGIKRASSTFTAERIEYLERSQCRPGATFTLVDGDLGDGMGLLRNIERIEPTEIYNLAGPSEVHASFSAPEATADANAIGTLRLLEAVRKLGIAASVRFYQASTSELFGTAQEHPQSESTPFHPRSPYAVAKLYAHWITVNYREAHGLHASNGILFNHESPLRGENFVTRKITRGVAAIAAGRCDCLTLGNLDARRDWGHARDFVEGMWLILQQPQAGDYVLATGESHTVRDFVAAAFACTGRRIVWLGSGAEETGRDAETAATLVSVDRRYFRPTEAGASLGNATKAREQLGWCPQTRFSELVAEMVEAERQRLSRA
jgi:GDPmannose 4,6-dehydratase